MGEEPGGGTLNRPGRDDGKAASKAGILDPIDGSSVCYPGDWRALYPSNIRRSKVVLWQVDDEPMVGGWEAARYVPAATAWHASQRKPWRLVCSLASASTAALACWLWFQLRSESCGPGNKRAGTSGIRRRTAADGSRR